MPGNNNLEKRAIKLALSQNWSEAIEVNKEILENTPTDLKAKIRLGTAYLQSKKFTEAAKQFKEVLAIDPIHPIAKKNFELATSKKALTFKNNSNNTKSLIKEPSTTVEAEVTITAKGITSNTFSYGTALDIKIKRDKAYLYLEKVEVAQIEDKVINKKLVNGIKTGIECTSAVVRGDGKKIKILIRCSAPLFKGDKQDVKPYLKKGSIEMPELEIESFDDE